MCPKTSSAVFVALALLLVGLMPLGAEEEERISLDPYMATAEEVKLQGFEVIPPGDPRYLAHTLGRYGLKPLAEEPLAPGEERFRFLWLRSFHPAALFELRFAADGTGVYEAKLWEKAPEGGRWVVHRTCPLAAGDLVQHRKALGSAGFYALPFEDARQGLDGATWLFEARDSERSHAVHRWSPQPGPLRELGTSLILSAIQSEFLPLY